MIFSLEYMNISLRTSGILTIVIFSIMSIAFSAQYGYAEWELTLNDGVVLAWEEYFAMGDSYCTRNPLGKFCILKRDVISLKEITTEAQSQSSVKRGTPSISAPAPYRSRKSGIPITGKSTSGVEQFDEVMLKFFDRTGATAAALAIARKGVMVHSRGYGWSDKEKSVPMRPNTMIGIASCEKPITAAAIRKLAREGRLNLDAKLFELLKIKPQGPVIDERVRRITINHLLEHKAGWGADPVSEAAEAARKRGFPDVVPIDSRAWLPDLSKNPIPMETFLGFVMTQRLKNEPGTRIEYCNFGFDTLRHVITKVTGRPYIEYFQQELFRPDVIRELKAHDLPRKKSDPPMVWNAETGGLAASAPALLAFMRSYWLTGEPRDNGNPLWVMYGSLPGSTAIMIWQPDGTDIAVLFNGRGVATHDEIRAELERTVENLK